MIGSFVKSLFILVDLFTMFIYKPVHTIRKSFSQLIYFLLRQYTLKNYIPVYFNQVCCKFNRHLV